MDVKNAWEFIFAPFNVYHSLDYRDYKQTTLKRKLNTSMLKEMLNKLAELYDKIRAFPQILDGSLVLFIGLHSREMVKQLSEHRPVLVIVKGNSERLWCVQNRIPYISGAVWNVSLNRMYVANSQLTSPRLEQSFRELLQEIYEFLQCISPKLVVSFSNTSSFNRAIAYVAKQIKAPVMSVQHGLMIAEQFSPNMLDASMSDYWLVWGEFHRNLCVLSSGLPEERVHILYPHSHEEKNEIAREHSASAVCFLGQPWEQLDSRFLVYKKRALDAVVTACRDVSLPLIYRPHPRESRSFVKEMFPALELSPHDESLTKAFDKYNVFVGSYTTALVDAALHGKIAVQLKSGEIEKEIGAEAGVYYLDCDTAIITEFLREVLLGKKTNLGVANSFIAPCTNVGSQLESIIQQVLASGH